MGFSVTTLAQKARTATLIADSDLNLGNYDLIATDVRGDTAEFSEFVGGVGNFSNVLGSGNLDIEGTGNIKGLTTFQNAVQVNGALHVEGSINNVNIADNGEITTAQGVNGADFNGVILRSSGTITVTPSNTKDAYLPMGGGNNALYHFRVTLLLYKPDVKYTGSIRLYNPHTSALTCYYYTGLGGDRNSVSIPATSYGDITFSNIPYLTVVSEQATGYVTLQVCKFTFS